ncbi:MAG: NAD(+) synthase, partial [Firmicutes bacterium]|nr:NAD(+) synthase [Bacillota bacterium]
MNIEKIIKEKIKLIQNAVKESGTKGFVFGNSGGKDSCLAGLLLKLSGVATVGIAMPCGAKRNYAIDKIDGVALANALGIKSIVVSLTDEYLSLRKKLGEQFGEPLTQEVEINIPPRLRMLTLYAYSQANSFLVAGTGNRSEFYLGYFTKWGDG